MSIELPSDAARASRLHNLDFYIRLPVRLTCPMLWVLSSHRMLREPPGRENLGFSIRLPARLTRLMQWVLNSHRTLQSSCGWHVKFSSTLPLFLDSFSSIPLPPLLRTYNYSCPNLGGGGVLWDRAKILSSEPYPRTACQVHINFTLFIICKCELVKWFMCAFPSHLQVINK